MEEERIDDPLSPGPSTSETPVNAATSTRPSSITQSSQAVIWKYFSRSTNKEANCNSCKKTLKTPTGTTSSIIRHLENKHSQIYKRYVEEQKKSVILKQEKQKLKMPTTPKQQKIEDHFKSTDKWAPNHPRSKTIDKAIGKWMAKSFHPYSLVDEDGFRYLMGVLEPKYNIPSRTTFSRRIIPELFDETKKRIANDVKTNLHDLKSLSLTTDLWTSASNDSFIAVTGHYIDPDFNIKSYCFGNSYFPEEHNAVNISSNLMKMMNEWGIEQSNTMPIFCISDNASNMVSAMTLTPWTHLRCFAHTLQLALSDAKKELPGMLGMLSKARAIVGHYKHSSAAQLRLNHIQEQLGKIPLQLVQDCETRWNSEYNMLSRLVALKQAVSAELSTSIKPHNLTPTEWELAEGYIYTLKPLDDATTLSSSGFLPTLSAVLPLIDGIRSLIKKFITAGKKGIMFARALDKSINLRFPLDKYLRNKHYLLAMMVDPRYKALILNEVNKILAVDLLVKEAMKILTSEADPAAASTSTSGRSQETVPDEEFSLWHHLQTLSQKSQPELSKENMVSNQVEAYINAPTIPMQENPCEWWKKNANLFGLVAPVAKRYLGIPATEVPSERIFSSAGNVVSERRRSLTQEHISELVFLHHNL